MAHGVQEVVCAAVADELEPLLEVGGERFVVGERVEVLLEALRAFEREQLARVVHHGRDLRPAADEARVGGEGVDLAVAHPRDALDLEPLEGGAGARPFGLDHPPAHPGLEDAL